MARLFPLTVCLALLCAGAQQACSGIRGMSSPSEVFNKLFDGLFSSLDVLNKADELVLVSILQNASASKFKVMFRVTTAQQSVTKYFVGANLELGEGAASPRLTSYVQSDNTADVISVLKVDFADNPNVRCENLAYDFVDYYVKNTYVIEWFSKYFKIDSGAKGPDSSAALAELQGTVGRLGEQLKAADAQKAELAGRLQAADAQRAELTGRLQAQAADGKAVAELSSTVAALKSKQAATQLELEKAQKQVADGIVAAQKQLADGGAQAQQAAALRAQVDELKQAKQQSDAEVARLQAQNKDAQAKLADTRKSDADAQRIAELTAAVQQKDAAMQAVLLKQADLAAQIAELKKAVDAAKAAAAKPAEPAKAAEPKPAEEPKPLLDANGFTNKIAQVLAGDSPMKQIEDMHETFKSLTAEAQGDSAQITAKQQASVAAAFVKALNAQQTKILEEYLASTAAVVNSAPMSLAALSYDKMSMLLEQVKAQRESQKDASANKQLKNIADLIGQLRSQSPPAEQPKSAAKPAPGNYGIKMPDSINPFVIGGAGPSGVLSAPSTPNTPKRSPFILEQYN